MHCWCRTPESYTHGIHTHIEISAFLVVIWCTYRNKGKLKFSALARAIVTEATVYFLVMLTAQVYIQISFNLVKVRSLSRIPHCFLVTTHNHCRVNRFHFCEWQPTWGQPNTEIPTSSPSHEAHTDCTSGINSFPQIADLRSQLQSDSNSAVCNLAEEVRGSGGGERVGADALQHSPLRCRSSTCYASASSAREC